jgi:CRP-like cAMP-binding protein
VATEQARSNRILRQLPAGELQAIVTESTVIESTHGIVLHATGKPIEHVYFPLSGMISLLSVTSDGTAIETGIVGSDGVVGGSCGVDGGLALGQATVQIDLVALRTPAKDFVAAYRAHEMLRSLVNKYQLVLLVQAQQSAACHALHTVNSRLCRWLLQSQDMIGGDEVNLTQEFLSHMLGVRRNTVSVEAHILQSAGLIRYSRGHITIVNRGGLEQCACECYAVIRDNTARAMGLD